MKGYATRGTPTNQATESDTNAGNEGGAPSDTGMGTFGDTNQDGTTQGGNVGSNQRRGDLRGQNPTGTDSTTDASGGTNQDGRQSGGNYPSSPSGSNQSGGAGR